MQENPTTVEDLEAIKRHINAEANEALVSGAKYAALLGFVGGIVVFVLLAAGKAHNVEIAGLFSFFASFVSGVIWMLAKQGRLRGALIYAAILPFVSLPTVFFILAEAVMPLGASSFITGPISYLYCFTLVVSGFFFDARVTLTATLLACAGYAIMVGFAAPHLAGIVVADPVFQQDVAAIPLYGMRILMIASTGLAVCGLSALTKRLVLRALHEEREKNSISRIFGQYVSEEVKEKILREVHTDGERKQVVILFSDLRGFTTFSESRPPEEIFARLNTYFDRMVDAITRNQGVVDKFIGDAIMAVFGGVLEIENSCDAALAAAVSMREELAALNAQWAAAGVEPLENGIGLHFGDVLQGNLGSASRKEFTVIGDAVNTASRVEGVTKEYGMPIVITDAVYARLSPEKKAWCAPLGAAMLKGKGASVELYGASGRLPIAAQ